MKQLLLLPYCLGHPECPERDNRKNEVYCQHEKCTHSSKCQLYTLKVLAEKEGFIVRLLRHDNGIPKILQETTPDIILGVPCECKAVPITNFLNNLGYESHYILLSKPSCKTGIPSELNQKEFIKFIQSHS